MGKGGCNLTAAAVKDEPNTLKDAQEDHDEEVVNTTPTTTSTSSYEKVFITSSFLATKNTIDECWIAYEGKVYDVTHWLAKHPGGIRSIMSAAGSDATSVMKSLHAPNTLDHFMKRIRKVGVLAVHYENLNEFDESNQESLLYSVLQENVNQVKCKMVQVRSDAIHKDFEALNQKLTSEGWYEADPKWYLVPIIRVAIFLYIGCRMVMWSDTIDEHSFSRILLLLFGSIFLGLYLQNIAFMGHDAGHGSISGSFKSDLWIGFLVGNAFAGIDVNWWKSTHNVHHSATNSLHDDPDIQHMPLLCFDERMGENRWSTYHGRYMPLDAIGRALLPYQHWYFYPVMAVARINLYIQSMIFLAKTCPFVGLDQRAKAGNKITDSVTGRIKEKYAWPTPSPAVWITSVLSLSFYWYMTVSFYSQLSLVTAIVSFTVCHLTSGLLHVQILLSHVAMHYCADGHGSTDAITAPNGNGTAGYYEWQALSTMDVDCPTWMDWFHGGLQFQLEHHLFPRVPRRHLRKLCALTDENFFKTQCSRDSTLVLRGKYIGPSSHGNGWFQRCQKEDRLICYCDDDMNPICKYAWHHWSDRLFYFSKVQNVIIKFYHLELFSL
jgi:Fatty acid desaturase